MSFAFSPYGRGGVQQRRAVNRHHRPCAVLTADILTCQRRKRCNNEDPLGHNLTHWVLFSVTVKRWILSQNTSHRTWTTTSWMILQMIAVYPTNNHPNSCRLCCPFNQEHLLLATNIATAGAPKGILCLSQRVSLAVASACSLSSLSWLTGTLNENWAIILPCRNVSCEQGLKRWRERNLARQFSWPQMQQVFCKYGKHRAHIRGALWHCHEEH